MVIDEEQEKLLRVATQMIQLAAGLITIARWITEKAKKRKPPENRKPRRKRKR